MTKITLKNDFTIRKLTNEFEDYKAKNNLDEYFKKYLSDQTRKDTLKSIQELMDVDSKDNSWFDELQEYRESL